MHSSPPPSRVTWPSATLVTLSKYVMSEEVGFTPGDVRAPFDRLELHCLLQPSKNLIQLSINLNPL
jgi:hypothetical protein